MKTNNFLKEKHPEAKKKLRLPDQSELVLEDGTVYRVRSFFAQNSRWVMCWAPSPTKKSIGRTESRHIAQWNL